MRNLTFKHKAILCMILVFVTACNLPTTAVSVLPSPTLLADTPTSAPPRETQTATHTFPPIYTSTETPTASLTFTPGLPPTATPTATQTFTPTPTPTETPTFTPLPVNAIFRGKVIPERLSCRFGPGVVYLFKFSVFGKIEVIGRMEGSSWLLVRAIGGKNSCWVNGEYMTLEGDVANLEPKDPHIVLPWSPYYGPLTSVSAVRNGDVVTVFWDPLYLRAGDSALQVPYVVEAWVCQNGEFVFSPVGAYTFAAKVIDEPGCSELSHARVFAAEKHGYTKWVNIPWPPHAESSTTSP